MAEEQLKTYYQLYTDLWKLVKTYHDAKSDEQWKALTDRVEELVQQYGEDARPIVLDTLELIEKEYHKSLKGISQYKLNPPIYRK